ncbi:MAG: hypothetical protein JXQ87_19590, partial [Bacteroidia bacterium]
ISYQKTVSINLGRRKMKTFLGLIIVFSILSSCKNDTPAINENPSDDLIETKNDGRFVQAPKETNDQNQPENNDNCQCLSQFENCAYHELFVYDDDTLKICSWFFDNETKEINEFEVSDCNNRTIFKGYPPSEYKLLNSSPLVIEVLTTLTNEKNDWKLQPVYHLTFQKNDSAFRKEITVVHNSALTHDSIAILKNRSELYLGKLFECALNEDSLCLDLFKEYKSKYKLDGSIGEMYLEMKTLLNMKENN